MGKLLTFSLACSGKWPVPFHLLLKDSHRHSPQVTFSFCTWGNLAVLGCCWSFYSCLIWYPGNNCKWRNNNNNTSLLQYVHFWKGFAKLSGRELECPKNDTGHVVLCQHGARVGKWGLKSEIAAPCKVIIESLVLIRQPYQLFTHGL